MNKSKIRSYDQLPLFKADDVVMLETLGEGGFGIVKKAYHKRIQKYLALKSFKTQDDESLNQIILEDDVLAKVEEIRKKSGAYDNFLEYYRAFKKDEQIPKSLLLQMENGMCTLDDILKMGKTYLCEDLLGVLSNLVKGFVILENNGIANRDVKAQNVILVESYNENYLYKISDFGIACVLPLGVKLVNSETITGVSKQYVAPEVMRLWNTAENDENFQGEDYNPFKSDVYSLGILVLKMIDYNFNIKQLKKGFSLFHESHKAKFSGYDKLLDLLEQILNENPQKRIDFLSMDKILDQLLIESKVSIAIKPNDAGKYYENWVVKEEENQSKNIKGLEKLYMKHKELYKAYNNELTQIKKSEYHLQKCLEILKKLKNNNDVDCISLKLGEEEIYISCELGCLYRNKGNLNQSEDKLKESLKMCYKESGIVSEKDFDDVIIQDLAIEKLNHSYFGNVFQNFGVLYKNMGNLLKSEEFDLKALKIFQKLYGENHADTACSYNNLGMLYYN